MAFPEDLVFDSLAKEELAPEYNARKRKRKKRRQRTIEPLQS